MNNITNNITEYFHLTYDELCEELKLKYGKVRGNYFINEGCKSENKKVRRMEDGLYIHHIKENIVPNLTNKRIAQTHPWEYQTIDNLVYCDLLEHILLHIKIYEETNLEPCGLLTLMIPEANSYLFGVNPQPNTHMTNSFFQKRKFVAHRLEEYYELVNYLWNVMLEKEPNKYYINVEDVEVYGTTIKVYEIGKGLSTVLKGSFGTNIFSSKSNILDLDIKNFVITYFEKLLWLMNKESKITQNWVVLNKNKVREEILINIEMFLDVATIMNDELNSSGIRNKHKEGLKEIIKKLKAINKQIQEYKVSKQTLNDYESVIYHLLFIFVQQFEWLYELKKSVLPHLLFVKIQRTKFLLRFMWNLNYKYKKRDNLKQNICIQEKCTNTTKSYNEYCSECKVDKVVCYYCWNNYVNVGVLKCNKCSKIVECEDE